MLCNDVYMFMKLRHTSYTSAFATQFCIAFVSYAHTFKYMYAGFTDWKERGVPGVRPVMMRFFLAVQVRVFIALFSDMATLCIDAPVTEKCLRTPKGKY